MMAQALPASLRASLPASLPVSAGPVIVGLGGLIAVALVLTSPLIAAVLLPAALAGLILMRQPFLGLCMLIALSHVDAVANRLSDYSPIGIIKLLTFGTFAVALLAHSTRSSRQAFRQTQPTPSVPFVILFILAMVLSFLFCQYENAGQDHMVGFLGTIILFFLTIYLTDTQQKLYILIGILLFTGIFSSAIMVFETVVDVRLISRADAAITAQWSGQARSSGASDFNPTTAAHMVLATTVIAAVMFLEGKRFKLITGIVAGLGCLAIGMTFARSALIGLVVVSIALAWPHRKHRLFPLAIAFLGLCAFAALPFIPEAYWERFGSLFNASADQTLDRRLSYNLIGLQLFRENPIIGIGPGNFPLHFIDHEFRWFPGRGTIPRQLHNTYLQVFVEYGILGAAMFLLALLTAVRAAFAAGKQEDPQAATVARAVGFAFIAFLIASTFMPNEDTKFMWILPGLCVAAWRLSHRRAEAA